MIKILGENYKFYKNQMKILELKNTVIEMKRSIFVNKVPFTLDLAV